MPRKIQIRNGRIYECKVQGSLFGPQVDVPITSSSGLLFPTATGKSYYKRGDFIFTANISSREAAMMFREFEGRLNEEFTWTRFLLLVLELDRITVTKRIESIQGAGERATIVLKPFLLISKEEMIELTILGGGPIQRLSTNDFRSSYLWFDTYDTVKILLPISKAVAEVTTDLLTGFWKSILTKALKKIGFRVMRKLVLVGGRRLLTRVTIIASKKAVLFMARVTKDTAAGMAKEYYQQIRTNQLRGAVDPAFVKAMNMEGVIKRAVRTAVAENLTKELTEAIEAVVPDGAAKGLTTGPLMDMITEHFTRELLVLVLGHFVTGARAAVLAVRVGNDPQSFSAAFEKQLAQELKTYWSVKTFEDVLKRATEAMKEKAETAMAEL